MISLKLKANKASLITITRDNPVDLQKALRRMLDRLDNFLVADIEYTMDDAKTANPKYSAIILGSVPEGYINLTELDTFDVDNTDISPIDNPGGDNPEQGGGQTDIPSQPENPPESSEDKLNSIEQKQMETSESIEELKTQISEIMELLKQLQQSNG